jgi:hypothetical protein
MSSFLLASPTNYKFNNYLSSCDLINKYNLGSVYENPKLSKIVLELSSQDILNACESGNKKEFDSDLQIKTFLLLYILQSNYPYINFNKIQQKKDGPAFSIKAVISSEEQIQSFLNTIFVENWNMLVIEDYTLLRSSIAKYTKHIQNNRKFVLNTKMAGSVFFEIDNFLNKNLFGLSSKNLNIKISFLFTHNFRKNKKISLDLIKNFPLFWTSNK